MTHRNTTPDADLLGVLAALCEDADDDGAWLALADMAEERGWKWQRHSGFDARDRAWLAVAGFQAVARGHNLEYISASHEYAEPGYRIGVGGIIFFCDWNTETRWVGESPKLICDAAARCGNVLEALGHYCQWSDEWTTCSDCNRAVRTQPNSYDWEPSYHMGDGELLCLDCWHHPSE